MIYSCYSINILCRIATYIMQRRSSNGCMKCVDAAVICRLAFIVANRFHIRYCARCIQNGQRRPIFLGLLHAYTQTAKFLYRFIVYIYIYFFYFTTRISTSALIFVHRRNHKKRRLYEWQAVSLYDSDVSRRNLKVLLC